MQKSTYFQTGRGDKQNCGKERLINEKGERKQKVRQTAQKMGKMRLNMVITVNVNSLNTTIKRQKL